jgi:N-acetylglucosamine malate deacetylase 1
LSFWQKETERQVSGIMRQILRIRILTYVKADKVLVLAAHPNDDILGCGGLLKFFADNGSKIKVIYFADGSRGTKSAEAKREIITEREGEAREAGKIIGIGAQEFIRLPDSELKPSLEVAIKIRREIEFDMPDLLLSPHFEDMHPDHHSVAEILYIGLKDFEKHLNIWLYEIWASSRINRIISIDDSLDDKKDALRKHKSQLKYKRYEESILALNNYRGLSTGAGEYAEAFYALGSRSYRRMFELLSRHHESRI